MKLSEASMFLKRAKKQKKKKWKSYRHPCSLRGQKTKQKKEIKPTLASLFPRRPPHMGPCAFQSGSWKRSLFLHDFVIFVFLEGGFCFFGGSFCFLLNRGRALYLFGICQDPEILISPSNWFIDMILDLQRSLRHVSNFKDLHLLQNHQGHPEDNNNPDQGHDQGHPEDNPVFQYQQFPWHLAISRAWMFPLGTGNPETTM